MQILYSTPSLPSTTYVPALPSLRPATLPVSSSPSLRRPTSTKPNSLWTATTTNASPRTHTPTPIVPSMSSHKTPGVHSLLLSRPPTSALPTPPPPTYIIPIPALPPHLNPMRAHKPRRPSFPMRKRVGTSPLKKEVKEEDFVCESEESGSEEGESCTSGSDVEVDGWCCVFCTVCFI